MVSKVFTDKIPTAPARFHSLAGAFLLFILFAVLARAPQYGNPGIHPDEEFYLLVGDRMLHGALPYVDIWDRKPIGLFLIYAAARLLGGEGIVQYQVLASLAAGTTASLIWLIARRLTGNFGATTAAISYIFWLNIYSGQGGQSPVFYNALIAAAALLAFKANETDDHASIFRLGSVGTAICGAALQIKYTVLPESIGFGLWFLIRMYRSGCSRPRLLAGFIAFSVCGIFPTACVAAYYALIGHFHDFVFANFISISMKGKLPDNFVLSGELYILRMYIPIIAIALITICQKFDKIRYLLSNSNYQLIFLWISSAFLGFTMVGNFYAHYFLPMLVPTLIAIAPFFSQALLGAAGAGIVIAWPIIFSDFPKIGSNLAERSSIEQITRIARPHLGNHCMFVYNGPAILYLTAQSCLPSRIVYPDHFSNEIESNALGLDIINETARILDNKPPVIITSKSYLSPQINLNTKNIVENFISNHYKLASSIKEKNRYIEIYYLKSPHNH